MTTCKMTSFLMTSLDGDVNSIDIHCLEFDFYHAVIANEQKSIELGVYIRGYSADMYTYFPICISPCIQDWYTEEA